MLKCGACGQTENLEGHDCSQPTPGPWKVGKRRADGTATSIRGPQDECVAVIWTPSDESDLSGLRNWEANARFIAAAPALMEALEGLYACNVWYGQIDDGDRARLLKARAALRAARGETT